MCGGCRSEDHYIFASLKCPLPIVPPRRGCSGNTTDVQTPATHHPVKHTTCRRGPRTPSGAGRSLRGRRGLTSGHQTDTETKADSNESDFVSQQSSALMSLNTASRRREAAWEEEEGQKSQHKKEEEMNTTPTLKNTRNNYYQAIHKKKEKLQQ